LKNDFAFVIMRASRRANHVANLQDNKVSQKCKRSFENKAKNTGKKINAGNG